MKALISHWECVTHKEGYVDVWCWLLGLFSLRAAAHSKLGNYTEATGDCERAIAIDPSYSKAYGRMGWDSLILVVYKRQCCYCNWN